MISAINSIINEVPCHCEMASSMHVFALELHVYLIRRKDQYDNIVAIVTDMLCALPVTIYFKQLFSECSLQYTIS